MILSTSSVVRVEDVVLGCWTEGLICDFDDLEEGLICVFFGPVGHPSFANIAIT